MSKLQITIGKKDLANAAAKGAIAPQDVENLWDHLVQAKTAVDSTEAPKAGFDFAQLAWYAGGVLVMIAMAWFMERAGNAFGTGAVFALSLAYGAGFAGLGYKLSFKDGHKVPGGLLFVLSVLMVPLAVVVGLDASQLAAKMNGSQIALIAEASALGVGLLAISKVRSSLLAMPIFGALWLASMTVADMVARPYWGPIFGFTSNAYLMTSMAIGMGILAIAFVTDSKLGRSEDYSWWGYLFGVAAFWIPLSMLDSGSELGKLAYFGVNVLFMLTSVVLARKVFLYAGAIGSIYYVGHVLWTYFAQSMAFPAILIAVGLGIIYLGVQYRKRQAFIEGYVTGLIPEGLRKHLPRA